MDRFYSSCFDKSNNYYKWKYEAANNETQSIPVKQNRIKFPQIFSKSFWISDYVQILQSVFEKLMVVYRISDHHPQVLLLETIPLSIRRGILFKNSQLVKTIPLPHKIYIKI